MTHRVQATALLAVAPCLAALAPSAAGPTAPLLAVVSTTAWLCTGWLLLVLLLERGSQLPGAAGRLAATAAARIAPSSVRALARVAVGASLAASVLAGPAALAEDRAPTVAGSAHDSLDWPGLAPRRAAPAPVPALPVRHVDGSSVVVRPGDSMWAIAARALGPSAADARVAQEWPRWWAANRAVVGDHPDLIHPGDRLSAP
ncbi:MAG: Peptidoglycan-binding lysin domain protein [Frankiales bacterium]|nr:Peptidoglycan-binding lysin domain protein [Frankiales bacterium]